MALATGASAAVGMPASAATPSCGPLCLDLYNTSIGSSYILDSLGQCDGTGTPVILDPAQNTQPGEDFTVDNEGTVTDFYIAGLVSAALGLNYGPDTAEEIEYTPFGAPTGECVGVSGTPTTGTLVSLQPCGVSGKTIWIVDSLPSPTGPYALINGADTAFPDPYTLTYPASQPSSAQLDTAPLETSSGSPVPAQDWDGEAGVVPGVGPVGTGTTVVSSANPSVTGQTVTYTATVSPSPDGGTVAFTDGGSPISGCSAEPVSVGTGTATCQVTYDSPGSHVIVASYGGDTEFQGSTSGQLTQQVNQAPTACTTTITGTHATQLAVTSGETCLVNATQDGQVTISAGAAL